MLRDAFQQPCLDIILGQAVPGTGVSKEVKQLRHAIEEVENLRDEEDEQRFAEVSHDTGDGKRHSGEHGVGVAHEDTAGEPV